MKAAVIYNSSAGTIGEGNDLLKNLKQSFKDNKIDAEFYKIDEPGFNLQEKDFSFADVIVAAGGDGTIRAVAEKAINDKKIFGVIPSGTLNHFAKDLDIPLEISDAVKLIAGMNSTAVDTAEANEKIFLNNASIGLYPKVVKSREKQQERLGRSKWAAMLFALFSIFKRFPLFTAEIMIQGKAKVLRTPIVFIGNNKYSFDLFVMGTRESLKEELLSVYIVKCKTRWRFFVLLVDILFNRMDQNEDFEYYQTKQMKITSRKKSLAIALDGEVERFPPEIVFKIIPKSLKVIAAGEKS